MVFRKRVEFEYQREYRVAIDTGTEGLEPITLNIGNIADIAFAVNTDEIDLQITIDQPTDNELRQ